jgi:hypothetical protein
MAQSNLGQFLLGKGEKIICIKVGTYMEWERSVKKERGKGNQEKRVQRCKSPLFKQFLAINDVFSAKNAPFCKNVVFCLRPNPHQMFPAEYRIKLSRAPYIIVLG